MGPHVPGVGRQEAGARWGAGAQALGDGQGGEAGVIRMARGVRMVRPGSPHSLALLQTHRTLSTGAADALADPLSSPFLFTPPHLLRPRTRTQVRRVHSPSSPPTRRATAPSSPTPPPTAPSLAPPMPIALLATRAITAMATVMASGLATAAATTRMAACMGMAPRTGRRRRGTGGRAATGPAM